MTHLEDGAGERACYRYRTEVILGRWRRQPERAIDDAIAAGQAWRNGGGHLHWHVPGEIEKSPCEPDAPCRGVYPPD